MSLQELLLALLLLGGSAFCSGAEIAFTGLNPLLPRLWHKERRFGATRTLHYQEHPELLLVTLLVGNNVINVGFSTLMALALLDTRIPALWVMLITTALVFVLGELAPKVVFHLLRNRVFPWLAWPVWLLQLLLSPVIPFIRWISGLGVRGAEHRGAAVAREFRAHMDLLLSTDSPGGADENGKRMARRVFELRDTSLEVVMTPRTEVVAIPESASMDEFRDTVIRHGYTKLPVYRDSIDHIVGYVMAHDLFHEPGSLKAILRPIPVSPHSRSVKQQLSLFGRTNCKITVVLDEFGGTAGIVCQEDLLEELMGAIDDEHDTAGPIPVRLADGRYFTDARVGMDVFFERVGLPCPETEWETLGGWLTNELGRIPARGERVTVNGLPFQVVSAHRNRLVNLMVGPLPAPGNGEDEASD